jgi:hypothetical protein
VFSLILRREEKYRTNTIETKIQHLDDIFLFEQGQGLEGPQNCFIKANIGYTFVGRTPEK